MFKTTRLSRISLRDRLHLKIINSISVIAKFNKTENDGIMVLLSSLYGSLGDEAMAVALIEEIKRRDPAAKVTLVVGAKDDVEKLSYIGVDTTHLPIAMYRTLRPKEYINCIKQFYKSNRCIVIGADVMDGKYSNSRSLRRLAFAIFSKSFGLRAYILGFSFSDDASEVMKEAFKEIPAEINLMCRENISATRLSNLLGRPIPYGADIAFMLKPSPKGEGNLRETSERIAKWKEDGRTIIGLNINNLALRMQNKGPDIDWAAKYSKIVKTISAAGKYGFLFIPHDYRGADSDDKLLRRLGDRIGGECEWVMPHSMMTPGQAKALAGECDIVLTGRMHLAIATLGSKVPAMVLDYQGKVEGLLKLFGGLDLAYTVDDVKDVEACVAKVLGVLSSRSTIVSQIEENLPDVIEHSKRHVDFIMDGSPSTYR